MGQIVFVLLKKCGSPNTGLSPKTHIVQMSSIRRAIRRRSQSALREPQTYVYDIFGTLAAEYTSQPSGATPPCSTCYLSTDHLGNTRLVTDANHNVIARHDYVPFGEEIPAGYAGRGAEWGKYDAVNQKFTSQERDSGNAVGLLSGAVFERGAGELHHP